MSAPCVVCGAANPIRVCDACAEPMCDALTCYSRGMHVVACNRCYDNGVVDDDEPWPRDERPFELQLQEAREALAQAEREVEIMEDNLAAARASAREWEDTIYRLKQRARNMGKTTTNLVVPTTDPPVFGQFKETAV